MLAVASEGSLNRLRDLYADEVSYHATLAEMLRGISIGAQIAALEEVRHQTRAQIGRLVLIFELVGARCYHRRSSGDALPRGTGMVPPTVWGSDLSSSVTVLSLAIDTATQSIGAYAAALADARFHGLAEMAILLEQSLAEERTASETLAALADRLARVPAKALTLH